MKHVVLHTIKYIYMYGYNIQLKWCTCNCIDIIIDIKILDLSYLKKTIKLCVLLLWLIHKYTYRNYQGDVVKHLLFACSLTSRRLRAWRNVSRRCRWNRCIHSKATSSVLRQNAEFVRGVFVHGKHCRYF